MKRIAMRRKGEFSSDLEDGKYIEDFFSGWTNYRIPVYEINRSPDHLRKYWDFEFTLEKKKIKVEIKADFFCGSPDDSFGTSFNEIGRGRIDYRFNPKRNYIHEIPIITEHTGLSITRSDWWVHYLHHYNEFWIIKVDDLKSVVKREREKAREEKRLFYKLGGKPLSIGCLLPLDNVRDDFNIFRIEERNEDEFWNNSERLYFLFNE